MSITPLTKNQRTIVAALVSTNRIQGVMSGGDELRARSFLENAEAAHTAIQHVPSNTIRHDLAYSVVHDVGEAMMAAYGYRTMPGDGGHESVAMFLGAIFDTPPPSESALRVDDMRRRRNDRYYRAYQPSSAETSLSVEDAKILLTAANARLP